LFRFARWQSGAFLGSSSVGALMAAASFATAALWGPMNISSAPPLRVFILQNFNFTT
tara:strand:- start:31083 stop:31253 length:171 start_codon:yes stop_codon:yes gene_type:complete